MKPRLGCENSWKIWGLQQMTEPINFTGEDFSEYSVKVTNSAIRMDCYSRGSITGGTGTEGRHTIGSKNMGKFLEAMKIANLEDFKSIIANYQLQEWRDLHTKICEFQTDSWSWSETNRDD